MIELGKKQELLVVKSVEFGVYLGEKADADAKNRVLLRRSRCRKTPGRETAWRYLFIKIQKTV